MPLRLLLNMAALFWSGDFQPGAHVPLGARGQGLHRDVFYINDMLELSSDSRNVKNATGGVFVVRGPLFSREINPPACP